MINNDEECIEFYNQNLKGKGLKIISLNKKCPDFLTYIRNRFNDTNILNVQYAENYLNFINENGNIKVFVLNNVKILIKVNK